MLPLVRVLFAGSFSSADDSGRVCFTRSWEHWAESSASSNCSRVHVPSMQLLTGDVSSVTNIFTLHSSDVWIVSVFWSVHVPTTDVLMFWLSFTNHFIFSRSNKNKSTTCSVNCDGRGSSYWPLHIFICKHVVPLWGWTPLHNRHLLVLVKR